MLHFTHNMFHQIFLITAAQYVVNGSSMNCGQNPFKKHQAPINKSNGTLFTFEYFVLFLLIDQFVMELSWICWTGAGLRVVGRMEERLRRFWSEFTASIRVFFELYDSSHSVELIDNLLITSESVQHEIVVLFDTQISELNSLLRIVRVDYKVWNESIVLLV